MDVKLQRVTLSSKACGRILRSSAVEALCRRHADKVAARANAMYSASGYRVKSRIGAQRAHAFVYTGDQHTMRSQHAHNTLQKAVRQ